MSRRKAQLFNLSFLDMLTSALGAVIFLFIITPKGGAPAAKVQQAAVYIDTSAMRIFGQLPDSLAGKGIGDTLFTVLVDYKDYPKTEKPEKLAIFQPEKRPPTRPEPVKKPPQPEPPQQKQQNNAADVKNKEVKKESPPSSREDRKEPVQKPTVYRGDAPSVPCKLSFEISWRNDDDNVDLFVCKGGDCVYGGNKRERDIGNWDSGKSRNRLFGNDLRTNQEAVRQFDRIIPGEYQIYALYKESAQNRSKVIINGLIYTKNEQGQERGESFTNSLTLGKSRVLLGKIMVQADGNYKFIKP